MKSDLTRDTLNTRKHFRRVLMQQGRVQIDADANEQAAILLHYLQTLTVDLLGRYAGTEHGFEIAHAQDENGANLSNDFKITAGRYYVDGILCENEVDCNFTDQPDYWPLPDHAKLQALGSPTGWVYMDVWERYISHLADDSIREKALGGPDTAGRAKVVWQVKVISNGATWEDISKAFPAAPWLVARVKPQQPSSDPCIISPESDYRGTENRLYRVEIHTGSQTFDGQLATPTFKWSRDNGSVATNLLRIEGKSLIVSNTWGFAAGQWVEVLDDSYELLGKPGTLVKVIGVEADILTLDQQSAPLAVDFCKHPIVRRWDHKEAEHTLLSADDAIAVREDDGTGQMWLDLEDGIQVQFGAGDGNKQTYRTGDYWLIPARTATGTIEWPVKLNDERKPELDHNNRPIPIAVEAHGIKHHYAPLAVITLTNGQITNIDDQRTIIDTAVF